MEAYYVFLALFLCFLFNLGTSTDILRHGDIITPNRELVSSSGILALGFFRPGNSSSSFVGIWYKNVKDSVIWVANRESPLPPQHSEYSHFALGDDGNLLLLDGARNTTIWSTNVSISGKPGNYPEAQLTDTGNLILKQGSYNVWESFDDASDTLMPGMRLMVNTKTGKRKIMRSWRSSSDPRPGKFSCGMDPNGAPQMFIWKDENIPYYRSGLFQYGYSISWYFPNLGYLVSLSFAAQGDEQFYFSYTYQEDTVPIRFFVSHDGYVQVLYKPKSSDKWQNRWQFPNHSKCEMYGSCGSFGSCDQIGSSSVCNCLEGFSPKSPKDWENGNYSEGCVRRIALGCNNKDDKFKRFPLMKWPDHPTSLGNITFTECEAQCYKNCSCRAYAYANLSSPANCLNWFGDLVDLAHNSPAIAINGVVQDLYVRVHASELNGNSGIQNSSHKNNRGVHVAVVIVSLVSVLFLIISVLGCILKRKYFTRKEMAVSSKSNASLVGNGDIELIKLSLERILEATDNFDEANKLGEGGFGPVYKGYLSEFGMVAIKRLCKRSSQGLEEFKNEVKLIAKLQHKNLVSLLGCCTENDEKILIYEYLPNRSLDKSLFDAIEKNTLDWSKRFQIIEGVAQGILYLHKYSRLKIIHRDLKASNILLDEAMKPKISDFGMARIFGLDQTQAETNHVVGTYGYIPPEYVMHGQFSEKSDVFSFGVLLLEMVNGQKNSKFFHSQLSVSLIGWAWKNWKDGHAFEFIDPAIRESCNSLEVIRCIEVGLLCVQAIPTDRPTMSKVILMLSNPALAIPPLKEPAFVTTNHSTESSDYYSKNEVTISVIEPR